MRIQRAPALRLSLFAGLLISGLAPLTAASAEAPAGDAATAGAGQDLAVEISGPTAGQGQGAVLLVPGPLGCAYGYRKVVPELNRIGLTTIIAEPLGVGASPRPTDADYSLTAQSVRLAETLDRLGIRRAIVVGHGTAASMAFRLALARPELVTGIVSLEGGATETMSTPGLCRALTLAGVACKLGGKHILRQKLEQELRDVSGDPSWIEGVTFRKYFGNYGRDTDATIASLRAMAKATEPEPLAPRLPRLACPVVLLVGEAPHDCGVAPEEITELQSTLPQLTVRRLGGCGHYVMEEQPAAVIAAVKSLVPQMLAAAKTDKSGD